MTPTFHKESRKKDRAKIVRTSRFFGVTKMARMKDRPWHAQITLRRGKERQQVHLGFFALEEEAAAVAAKARKDRDAGTLKWTDKQKAVGHAAVAARLAKQGGEGQ